MKSRIDRTSAPLITQIQKLFSHELAQENDFLRQEYKILRSKLGKRVPLTETDRRTLVRYGMPLKDRLREVISIVCPETLLAWNRRMKRRKWIFDNSPKRPGRPPKAKATEALALRMARENAWGYVRISGELKKLGHKVSPSFVRDLMKKHGIPPSPYRKGLSWKQFIQAHLEVTWAADFFPEEVWTRSGLVTYCTLFFIHLGTRRVQFAGCTPQPEARWMQQQARNFARLIGENVRQPSYLIHDRDGSFFPLDAVLRPTGIKVIQTPPQSPTCNAYAERFVRETRETLDQLILLGEGHLRHVLKKIEPHHNHSYRYAWAERAKAVGYPERFAQEALGHNSKAVHRAYAKRALMKIPSLEYYEQRAALKVEPAAPPAARSVAPEKDGRSGPCQAFMNLE